MAIPSLSLSKLFLLLTLHLGPIFSRAISNNNKKVWRERERATCNGVRSVKVATVKDLCDALEICAW